MIVKKPTIIEEAPVARNVWHVEPEVAVTVKDMLDSDYWAHVASRIRAGDRIEAVPSDRHYFAEFFVVAASSNWVKLKLLREITLIKDNDTTRSGDFVIKFAGRHKWRVERGSEILSKDHDDKELAEKWLEENKSNLQ